MRDQSPPITLPTLADLPSPVRMLFSCFLVTIGVGYLTAIYYLFVVDIRPYREMGMTVVEGIAAKYHGRRGDTRLEAALSGPMSDKISAEDKKKVIRWIQNGASADDFNQVQSIFDKNCTVCHSAKSGLSIPPFTTYDEVTKVVQVDTGSTLGQLARVSHIHLFGISVIFLLTGIIFALSSIPEKWRLLIIVLPYLSIWADIGAWWITKYEPIFAYVVLVGGGLMGLALAVQIAGPLWEMWFIKRSGATFEKGEKT